MPFLPIFLITVIEQLEYFEKYKKWLTMKNGDYSMKKLVGIRLLGGLCIMSLTFLSDNVVTITDFTGNLCMPLCSF